MNSTTYNYCLLLVFLVSFLVFLVSLSYFFIDGIYIIPLASDNANEYCKSIGFDQYKEYSRFGLFSKQPIGIKCEYAEKYTDLGIRTNQNN